MGRIARTSALLAASMGLVFSPIAAQADTRARDSATYEVSPLGADAEMPTSPDSKKRRKGGALVSHEDLSSILLLAGGFGLAFILILGGGSSGDTQSHNQSNGAN